MGESTEKRHFVRIAMEGRARLACGSRNFESRLLDISLRGALISRPSNWDGRAGDPCGLEIILLDSDITISMEGAVAHVGSSVMGFRCDHIDLESISHLRRLVELNLGEEQLLGRELGELLAHPV
jgi:hypothetical protein